jgi:hypothetical protein
LTINQTSQQNLITFLKLFLLYSIVKEQCESKSEKKNHF